jgi:hypothetical protein
MVSRWGRVALFHSFCCDTEDQVALINAVAHAPTKLFKIRGGSSKEKYQIATRLDVSITASGIDVKWNCLWMGLGWERDFLRQHVLKMDPPPQLAATAATTTEVHSRTHQARSVPTPPARSEPPSNRRGGWSDDVSALLTKFSSLPAYFDNNLSKLSASLAKFGAWIDDGDAFALEFNYDIIEFDTEVHEQNCDSSMKGKLLKNCGLLVEAAFKKISALASKRDFAAACTKRTIRFELHDNYRDARRYWIGVPESDLRTGALVFYCTTDSFLPSRVTKIGEDIEEEIKSLSNARDDGDDDDDRDDHASDSDEPRGPVIKECSACKGRGVKLHNACSGRGCSRCGKRGTMGEKCTNCHGKGHFKYN